MKKRIKKKYIPPECSSPIFAAETWCGGGSAVEPLLCMAGPEGPEGCGHSCGIGSSEVLYTL